MEVSKLEFREMVRLAKTSFEKTQSITYERYKLFKRSQETGETLEAFHAALTAQVARAELGTLEDELVRYLFISKRIKTVLQDTLTFETFPPEEVLKRILKFKKSEQTTQAFQKLNTATAKADQFIGAHIKIKQEPIIAIGNKGPNKRRQTMDQYKRRTNDTKNNGRSGIETKTCIRCERAFVEGHLKKCSAMGKTLVKTAPNPIILLKFVGHSR